MWNKYNTKLKMKALSTLLKEFDGRHKSENQLTECFKEIAKSAIIGGYFLINESMKIRIIEVEFYFHSENDSESNIHDWGMYHRGEHLDYFTLGSLNPHRSGIDVTFEREKSYRASFLIRKYQIDDDEKIISTPSYLCEDMFGYTGCICGDGPKVQWVNDLEETTDNLELTEKPRINLSAYDENGKPLKLNGKRELDKRPWRFGL